MKTYEKWCIEDCAKHKNNWESYCIAKDAWLAGYRAARDTLPEEGQVEVMVEFPNGAHQLHSSVNDAN